MIDKLRHLFLPHHTNNFRAKLLHVDFFAIYVVIFFMLSFIFRVGHKINPNILGFATDIRIEQLLELTNNSRLSQGLAPLNLDQQLSQAAAGKANDMFGKDYWAHTAPDGSTPWDFINGAGYVYKVAGENLAKNFSTSSQVVEAWMNSLTHKENILREQYQDVGFAVVNGRLNGEETTLVVQMFGNRLTPTLTYRNEMPANQITVPIEAAQAQEASPAIGLQGSPQPSPVKVTAFTAPQTGPPGFTAGTGIIKHPLLDIGSLFKHLLLGLSGILMLVLIVDGIYIWRKRIVRVTGRNMAHLIFIFIITGLVWMMSFGSIL